MNFSKKPLDKNKYQEVLSVKNRWFLFSHLYNFYYFSVFHIFCLFDAFCKVNNCVVFTIHFNGIDNVTITVIYN